MTKAHAGKQIAQIPGGSYDGQLVAQPVIDPATGQVVIDPATGQPMTQYVDASSGQAVQTTIDPATGQLMQLDPATGQFVPAAAAQAASQPIQTGQMVDPATGMPINATGGMLVDANGVQIDPATGMPVGQVVQPQAIDPVTGYPLQGQSNGVGQAPIDANTGLPMMLVVDPATGQQVWVPSAPAQMQPPAPLGQPVPIENERSQRTLMDLIFGDQQN
jgi:penicillin-binding protein 1A